MHSFLFYADHSFLTYNLIADQDVDIRELIPLCTGGVVSAAEVEEV